MIGMKKLFGLSVAFLACQFAFSQRAVVADKIVGIVGDKIILKSDITNAITDAKRQGQEVPPNGNCMIMQQALAQKALVLQAEKDSLIVSDDEVEALLDNQIRAFIQQYGSKEALEQIAGRSIYQLKEDFREPFKERKQAEMMRNKIVENVKVTPNEVKEYFDKIPKDSLPFYESELEVGEIVLYPKANKDVEDYVSSRLYEMKKQVETGQKKFDALAKLYSEDPGSKENGGQYNINRTD